MTVELAIFTLAAAVILAVLILLGAVLIGSRRMINEVLNTKIPAGGRQTTLADILGDTYTKVAGLPAGEEIEGLLKDIRKMINTLPPEEIAGLIKDLRSTLKE